MKFDSLINIELTQGSGQTSQPSWKNIKNVYSNVIIINNVPILLKTSQTDINSFNLDYELPTSLDSSIINQKKLENDIKSEINKIYDLNFDLNRLYDYLSQDDKLLPSIDFCKGLRLFLAVDPFECIVSSITSSNNSIKRWTTSINKIKQIWGDEYQFPSGTFYKFPPSEIIMGAYESNIEEYEGEGRHMEIECYKNNLKACGLGYRVPYVKQASEIFTLEMDLNDFFKMTYDEAYDEIIKIKGVGPKVADCILLYGFHFKEAFPSDIWIKRIISYLYFDKEDISVRKVREFGMEKFGNYAGYVQLYLFHYARKSGLLNKLSKK